MDINPSINDRNLAEDYRDQTIDAAQAALAAYVLALMLKPKRDNQTTIGEASEPDTEIELDPGDIEPGEAVKGPSPDLPPDPDSLAVAIEPQFEPLASQTQQAIVQAVEEPETARQLIRAEFEEGTGIAVPDKNGELDYSVVVGIDNDDNTLIVAGVKENLQTILDPKKTEQKAVEPKDLKLKKIDPKDVALADKFGDRIDQLQPDQLHKMLNQKTQPKPAVQPKPVQTPKPTVKPKP